MKDHFGVTPLTHGPSFADQLKGKSRRRRKDLARMAKAQGEPRALRNDLLPRLELALVPLERLKMPARQVRKLHPAHMRQVADSIGALGFCSPILIGKDNLVLDGAARVEAARSLGFERAPCVRIEHLSDSEQRVLRLAINRLGETGGWSLEALKIEFEELILADAPIEISGFSLDEIDQIVLGDGADGLEKGPSNRIRSRRNIEVRRYLSVGTASDRMRRCDRSRDPAPRHGRWGSCSVRSD